MFGNKSNSKKPVVRRETVQVPSEQKKRPFSGTNPVSAARQPPSNRFQLSQRRSAHTLPASNSTAQSRTPVAAKRAIAASKGRKRQSATPDRDRVQFSSEDDDEDDSSDLAASDSDASRKRIKSSVSSVDSSGPRRPLVSNSAFDTSKEAESLSIIHGADATNDEHASKFKNPWNQDYSLSLKLQYPTNSQRERFELKWPKNEKDDYRPIEDITQTIATIIEEYFPPALREKFNDEKDGFGRRFSRSWHREDQEEFERIVDDFNDTLSGLVADGTTRNELVKKHSLSLDLISRIQTQIYGRTVSPKVEILRAYQNGGDNVYGELLPRFCSKIFKQVSLNHEQVFIDLGSGVGNVVVQAALEIGCESWGMEMMKNPCDLAELQAREFPGRTKLWGIDCGDIHLLRGDFTDENPEMLQVLKRADVVLVNNQAFTPSLNDKLMSIFLDLKDGAKVVSLKPFVPEGHKITHRNQDSVVNMFTQQKFEYYSGSVSWTDKYGNYYVAEKDLRPLERFKRVNGLS